MSARLRAATRLSETSGLPHSRQAPGPRLAASFFFSRKQCRSSLQAEEVQVTGTSASFFHISLIGASAAGALHFGGNGGSSPMSKGSASGGRSGAVGWWSIYYSLL